MRTVTSNSLPSMALVGALFAILVASPASTQETLRACYVPKTGVMYRVGTADTPEECRSDRHVEFKWDQQPAAGALAAVTFTTASTQIRPANNFAELLSTSFTTTADGPAVISFYANAAQLPPEPPHEHNGLLFRLMIDGAEVFTGNRIRNDFESEYRDAQMYGFDWAVNLKAGSHTVAVEWVGLCGTDNSGCATMDSRSLIVRHGN